ncbi:MAG: type II toxin-antitoxin system HicA family toxin [Neisseriaceae bacterium]|nr:type II toxin-antitoxin system HicA family toxin [Neisseriaceae bacterium]
MNSKQQKTFNAIFTRPTQGNIRFGDIEKLVVALGGTIEEGNGSRVKFALNGAEWHGHRPHPEKEAKRYQIETLQTFFMAAQIQGKS